MAEMAKRWLQVEQQLEGQIAALSEHIATLSAQGKTITQGQLYRLDRYKRLLGQAIDEFDKYVGYADGVITAAQRENAMLGVLHAQEAIGAQTLGVAFDRLNPGAVADMIAGTTGEGSPLRKLLYERMVKDATGLPLPGVQERLTRTLINATAQGWNPRKTARMIRDDLSGGLNKALQITRTEQIRSYRQAAADQYKASGIVTQVKRLCAHNERTCIACLADEGKLYPADEPLPDHVQGRCTGIPVVPGADIKFQTGEDWLKSEPESVQRFIMGKGRFEAWKAGDAKFSDFVTHTDNETWGGGITPTPLKAL